MGDQPPAEEPIMAAAVVVYAERQSEFSSLHQDPDLSDFREQAVYGVSFETRCAAKEADSASG